MMPRDLEQRVAAAVRHFWQTRKRQQEKQRQAGRMDHGLRGAATGGKQAELLHLAGRDT